MATNSEMNRNRRGPSLGPADWNATKERWRAFWRRDLCDRPILNITVPKIDKDIKSLSGVISTADRPVKFSPEDAERIDKIRDSLLPDRPAYTPCFNTNPGKEFMDIDQMIRRNLYNWSGVDFMGDAFAVLNHRWSVADAMIFGCEPGFNEFAPWCDPVDLPGDPPALPHVYENGEHRKWMLDSVKKACIESQGRFFTRTDWGNYTGDVLSSIRGSNQLMEDIGLRKEWVRKAADIVTRGLLDLYRDVCETINQYSSIEGMINYLKCWSDSSVISLDCDVCCMISPSDFTDLFFNGLVEAVETFDCSIFHLDGPGAIKHLDKVMSIPELNAIQWVPGAGHTDIYQWVDLLQHIQKDGKKALLIQIAPSEADDVIKNLSPKGLAVSMWGETHDEVLQALEKFEKWRV